MQKKIVFIHGWGMNNAVWSILQQELELVDGYSTESLNIPGFGGEPYSGEFEFTAIASQLANKISPQSVLVGWSLGGLFAQKIAINHPEKVSRLVLVSSSPAFCAQQSWPGIDPTVLANFEQQLQKDSEKTIERFLAIQAMGSEHARDDVKQLKRLLASQPKSDPDALAGGLKILKSVSLKDEFASIKQPLHGVFGRLDSLVPIKAVQKMQQLNPNFKVEVIAKASHAPFISHKDEFINILNSIV
ncbi:pimeloyl-ACP methyl ester esterase BioH [Pseudoalteromonas sp. T1lg65]|uniref:pimeloyl-ACP methyl ester esterase BioH n=1 Tax=Pseudoalteromonas sp. T1lg65 TaxID=2077101 RepID=UPI003F798778